MSYLGASSFEANAGLAVVLVAFLALIGNWPLLWRKIRFRRKANWPVVQATVEGVSAQRSLITDGSSSTYKIEIGYSYFFNGHYYSGYYLCDTSGTENQAYRLAKEYPKGTVLPVRVHPTKPEVSVLSMDD